jgi:hypothetical protein
MHWFRINNFIYSTLITFIYVSTALRWALSAIQFLDLFTRPIWLLGWEISPSQGCIHRTGNIENKLTLVLMPQVGFVPTVPVFERAKTRPSWSALITFNCNTFVTLLNFHLTIKIIKPFQSATYSCTCFFVTAFSNMDSLQYFRAGLRPILNGLPYPIFRLLEVIWQYAFVMKWIKQGL